jgi:molecular chaperone GrpE
VSKKQQPNVEETVDQVPTEPLLEEAEEGRPEVEEAVDELTPLRQELGEARAKEAEYLDGWQRARAELANARKRFQRDQERAYASAKADLLVRLLPIVDDFERAFDALPDNPSSATWVEGIRLIHQKLQALLEQEGVAPIEATGKEFDPFLHQALTHEPSEDVPEGQVIAEVQRGYQVGDRVLRPSVVRVSSGPPPEPEPEAEPTEEDESPDERRS